MPWYFTKKSPDGTKACASEGQCTELVVCPPCCPKHLKFHNFTAIADKAPLEQPLVVKNKVQQSPSLLSPVSPEEGSYDQHLPIISWIAYAMLSVQQIFGWLKSPVRARACEYVCSYLSTEGLIRSVFLVESHLSLLSLQF